LDIEYLKNEFKKINISGYEINAEKIKKRDISCIKVNITVKDKQKHRSLKEINALIDKSELNPEVKKKSKDIFLKLAKAESKVHNIDIDKIHFHEIGAIDSILDIIGAVIGLDKLNLKKIYCSTIPVGRGFVKSAHGKLPIPAPATSELLKGIPTYSTKVEGELVTPTGAAIITSLTNNFGEMPLIQIEKIGYGAGKSDFDHPNLLRIFVGESLENYDTDVVNVIEVNIDDMNPEYYEVVFEKLLKNGALDVYLTNIQMKKNRPGIKLSIISPLEITNELTDIIFNETTTFGLRIYKTNRKKLFVEKEKVETKYGEITIKIGKTKDEIKLISPEYEDCKKLAQENNVSLKEIY
ncbi:MAG: nickel pincer cofactor biosynthesis protein LarC, partial [Candidatus Lokiarchaeota archaeon]|nr:nickel pincer cofactor biosynthesis protein LarC [Candidatus Lokiarchaeota archaeon]